MPTGAVCFGDENQVCPLTVLTATSVITSERSIEIKSTEAQNFVLVDDKRVLWAADRGVNIEKGFSKELLTLPQVENLQDMWSEPLLEDEMETLFDFESKPPLLGFLYRDGAIWYADQQNSTFVEATRAKTRRPLRHALLRREATNGKSDTWPCVVFEEHPRTVYRLPTTQDLLSWLDGAAVPFVGVEFPSVIAKLLTCHGIRGQDCMALTEDGRVYVWERGACCNLDCRTLPEELSHHLVPESKTEPIASEENTWRGNPFPARMVIPAITYLATGAAYGAAITQDGALYIFMTYTPWKVSEGRSIDPHLAEFHIGGPESYMFCKAYDPRLAKIRDEEPQPKIVDVAVGNEHIVALTSEGEVYTVGEGMFGQLGVGDRQFELHSELNYLNEAEESWEFAEKWQRLELKHEEATQAPTEDAKIIKVGAGSNSTLLVLSRLPKGEAF